MNNKKGEVKYPAFLFLIKFSDFSKSPLTICKKCAILCIVYIYSFIERCTAIWILY